MDKTQQDIGVSLRATQQLLDRHSDIFGRVNESSAREQLNSASARVDAAAVEQGACVRESRGLVGRRKQLEELLRRKYLIPLAGFSRSQLAGVERYADLTQSASNLMTGRLILCARSMAEAAAPLADRLHQEKFPVGFLDDLRKATDDVQSCMDQKSAVVMRRVGATTEIASALRLGRSAIARLDALVASFLLEDSRLAVEWRAATRLKGRPDSPRSPQRETSASDEPSSHTNDDAPPA